MSGDLLPENSIYIRDCNHLIKPPAEFAAIGNDLIRAYFDAIKEQGEVALNEVKILLIGDGGSGKTSLAYRLTKPGEELPTQEERTRGIDVFDWKFRKDKTDYVAHLWDFGGQVMYDMVHQYFYSQRSLYILLDSSRSGANEHDSRLNQLLLSAELFGRGSTMIMVQNQHSDHTKKIDTGVLKTNYGFIEEFPVVNLKTGDGLDTLKTMLKNYIQKIPGMGAVMPTKWMAVRKAIDKRARKTSTIRLDEYRQICTDCGIGDEKAQNVLSRYLHQLGVFLHFQENTTKSLYKLIILNREWATKASYAVFDAEVVKQNTPSGSFSTGDLAQIWQDEAYKDYHAELLDLMGEFEICFQLESTGTYLIPRMMDKMPDDCKYCDSAERPLHFYCLLYTSPSPRDLSTSRMPSSA